MGGIFTNGAPLLNAITYHPFGPAKSWKWGANLIDYVRTFDKDGRLQTYPLGDSIRRVGYDRADRVSSYTTEGQIKKFVYDDADRLTFAWLKKYRYGTPPNGDKINRTSYTNASAVTSTWTIKNTNNQLNCLNALTCSPSHYLYDASGNMLSDSKNLFQWDGRQKLYNSSNSNSDNSYVYNGLGERVAKMGSGVKNGPNYFVYDVEGHLLGEYDKNNTAIQETIYLGDTPVAVVKPDPLTGLARTFYIHADHLNAPRVIVNTANKPVWRWDNSDAFGLGLPDQNPDGNTIIFEYNLRFPGQYYDKQTGLFYNYQRYYDPFTGRYISADALGLANGLAGSVNPYSYVEHNPLNYIDPFGLELTVGFGQGIRNLADGAKLPNGGEGVASMSGPGSPLGPVQCAADAAANAAPIGKLAAVVGGLGKVAKGLTIADFPKIAKEVSQKQLRHIADRPELAARGGGSYLNSKRDAQTVLDAYHSGLATILGKSSQGFPVVRVDNVTGINVNIGAGFPSQPTNVFIIKGTISPSVVPTNPNWMP